MQSGKIIFFEKRELINESGIIESEKITQGYLPSEPGFVKLYLEDVSKLYNLKDNVKNTLIEFVRLMDYQNIFWLNKDEKVKIAKNINTTVNCINQNINKLLKAGIIYRESRSKYKINPNIISKGSWEEINKMRKNWKLEICYFPDGENKTINADIEK